MAARPDQVRRQEIKMRSNTGCTEKERLKSGGNFGR
jgi:hypothetical protein